ncbi:MAG: glycine cleavage system protein [Bryobacterales bacterium]|nr:glycine cleavage system protein [Bryobacterales bacterium]
MSYPETFRYTKEHEWIAVTDSVATVGITWHAQHELGDIVYVDLPKVGTHVDKGRTFGSVESVKAVSDIYSPVTGEVVEANDALATTPEQLNADPHESAWLIKVRIESDADLAGLMSAAEYTTYAGAES